MYVDRADIAAAERILVLLRTRGVRLAVAESCTGGLLAALLTEPPGASDVLERGFVTYSNQAKIEMLGVDAALIAVEGAVSRACAVAMAEGALRRSCADLAVAITGLAGPGGGSPAKPVGLVHLALASSSRATMHQECRFGAIGRDGVRRAAVAAALALLQRALETDAPSNR